MWDQRYSSEEYFYGTEPNDFLRDTVGILPPGGRILSLGEGEGRNAVFLAARGFRVTAVDGSTVALEKLARLAHLRHVHVERVVEDLRSFDFGLGQWDVIISIWCHLPKSLRQDVLRRCLESLKPSGMLLMEAYIPRQIDYKTGGPSDLDLLPTLAELRVELASLDEIVGREMDRDVHEGRGHHGKSAVVQYLGRRKKQP